jgi:hypothetical protein
LLALNVIELVVPAFIFPPDGKGEYVVVQLRVLLLDGLTEYWYKPAEVENVIALVFEEFITDANVTLQLKPEGRPDSVNAVVTVVFPLPEEEHCDENDT